MLFSYNWLQSFFDKKLPEPKELARLIIKHSFEVEAMENPARIRFLTLRYCQIARIVFRISG